MTTTASSRFCGALLLLLFGAACSGGGGLTVSDGHVRPPPPGADVTAAYFTLRNAGNESLTLIGASSPDFARVEIHSMDMSDGMMRMRQLASLPLAAGATVNFEPGGLHLMLFESTGELPAEITLELSLESAGGKPRTLAVRLPVDSAVR